MSSNSAVPWRLKGPGSGFCVLRLLLSSRCPSNEAQCQIVVYLYVRVDATPPKVLRKYFELSFRRLVFRRDLVPRSPLFMRVRYEVSGSRPCHGSTGPCTRPSTNPMEVETLGSGQWHRCLSYDE
jgi:hypothetical protein